MRIVLFLNGPLGLGALERLADAEHLAALVLPDFPTEVTEHVLQRAAALEVDVVRVDREGLSTLPAQLASANADTGLVVTFPWQLPVAVLDSFPGGVWNVHAGVLPQYRGPDPIFWQILDGAEAGGVTVHRMNERLDAGPVLLTEALPFHPGETYGVHMARVAGTINGLMPKILEQIQGTPELTPQDEDAAVFQPCPETSDIIIDWGQPAAAIERLVNACNPAFDGAVTFFGPHPWRVLEVAVTEGEAQGDAGQVVQAHVGSGTFVLCGDGRVLALQIVRTAEGFLTGTRLAALGLPVGLRFHAQPTQLERPPES